jgi:hypothetical protein
MFEADRSKGVTRWGVVRLGVGSKTRVVLLSPRFFSLTTHWCGHTVPCAGEECSLCELLPGRGQFYVAVQWDGRVSLLELGAVSASHFEQHLRLFGGGLRAGAVVDLSRRSKKMPTYSEAVDFKEGTKAIELLDLAAHVMALYRFPCPNPSENLEQYELRIHHMSVLRNRRLRDQMAVAKK